MSLDSNAELLPCPFCGCSEIVGCSEDGAHWDMCAQCGAAGPVTTRYSGDEGEECASWNSRPRYTALLLEVSELRNHNRALLVRSQPSEWVATSERMPPECEHVLFADVRGGVHKGYQATRHTYGENDEETPVTIWCAPDYAGGEEWEAGEVSHWQPLPNPPALLPPNTEAKS